MSARDLGREISMVIEREWGAYRENVMRMLRNNLPNKEIGTIGNGRSFDYGESVASSNKILYATGALQKSYKETVISATYTGPWSGRRKISEFTTDKKYAAEYANGKQGSPTYHGFDYIGQTISDINSFYDKIRAR